MNTRITRETMMLEMAHIASKRGTCGRLSVGTIIARDFRPISLGYVGAPSGWPHCEEARCNLSKPCTRTVHAEINAIQFAQSHGIDIKGADMFSTDSPCATCASQIAIAEIARVFFDREYRDSAGIAMLYEAGVEIHRVLSNGMARRVFL